MTTTSTGVSSRIIVKNLPKWITEDRLRRHFGCKGQITDVKLMYTRSGIFRRFAYVGFTSVDEAAAAVKYFDKTFVDTSRMQVEFAQRAGSEELSRPWSRYSAGSSAHEEYLRKRAEARFYQQAGSGQANSRNAPITQKTEAEEKLERKRRLLESIYGEGKEGEKLREFISVMKPASQAKVWDNDEPGEPAPKEGSKKRTNSTKAKAKKVELISVADKRIGSRGETTTRVHVKFEESDEEGPDAEANTQYASPSSDEEYQEFTTRIDNELEDFDRLGDNEKAKAPPCNSSSEGIEEEETTIPVPTAMVEPERGADVIADTGRLFVRNLSYACTEEELRRAFEPFGPLAEVHLSISKDTKKPKGFAYILFMFPEHALRAYSQLDGTILLGRIMHIIPAEEKPKTQQEDTSSANSFRAQRERELKASASNDYNWNSLFLRSDTVLDAIAAKLGVQKSAIMSVQSDNLATRLAIAETNLIHETKAYLEQEGVILDAFVPGSERSKNVLLVKNLPFDTDSSELHRLFSKFGSLGRLILPPVRGVALIEFFEPSEARAAFRALAYSKFKHVPLFLEWAPMRALAPLQNREANSEVVSVTDTRAITSPSSAGADPSEADDTFSSTSTLYIKNLNFSTTSDTLKTVFSAVGPVRSAKVATKKVDNKELSLGFGFVEFERRESLNRALDELQGYMIDGHAIILKRSTPSRLTDAAGPRSRTKTSMDVQNNIASNTKLVVRNIPFEASEKEVRELFKAFAQLKRVRLPRRYDGRHRGFGFVEFLTHQEAANAKTSLAHTHLYGRHLVLEWAKLEAEDDEEQLEELREQSKRRSMVTRVGDNGDSVEGRGNKRIKLRANSSNHGSAFPEEDFDEFDEGE